MTGARIEITEDSATGALQSARSSLQGDGGRVLLSDIGEYLTRSTRERAEKQVAPDGSPWQPLSPGYKAWKDKKRPGLPILKFDFHMLGDQFAHQVIGRELFVGTNAPYGAIHQFGGDIDIPARQAEVHFRRDRDGNVGSLFVKKRQSNFAQSVTIPAHTITMPARPFLGISAEDEQEMQAIAQDHLMGLFAPQG